MTSETGDLASGRISFSGVSVHHGQHLAMLFTTFKVQRAKKLLHLPRSAAY